jgi:hypothetical protein
LDFACTDCNDLKCALERAERERIAARARFEAQYTLRGAESVATEYRAASSACRQTLEALVEHRDTHK